MNQIGGGKGIGRTKTEELKNLSKNKDAKGILQFIERNIDDFNGRNMAEAFSSIKGIANPHHLERVRTHPVFLALAKRTTEHIASNDETEFFHPIGLSLIANATSKIGRMEGTDALFGALSKHVQYIEKTGTPQATSFFCYSIFEIGGN